MSHVKLTIYDVADKRLFALFLQDIVRQSIYCCLTVVWSTTINLIALQLLQTDIFLLLAILFLHLLGKFIIPDTHVYDFLCKIAELFI